MNTLSIERDGREVTVLGSIGDNVRVWIDSSDVGTAIDLNVDEVARVAHWLEAWLFRHGQTSLYLCKQQHRHRSPYDVELCNMAYQHIEAARSHRDATYKAELQCRNELNELQGHIRAIMQAVQP